MTQGPSQSNAAFAYYLDPEVEGSSVTRYIVVAIVCALLAGAGLFLVVSGAAGGGTILAAIGAAGAALFIYLAVHQSGLSKLSGDDLLAIAVDEVGILGPDKVRVPWAEVTRIEVNELGSSSDSAIGSAAGRAAVRHTPRMVIVHAASHANLLAAAVGPQRKYIGKAKGGAAEVMIGLGQIDEGTYVQLVAVLQAESARRGFPLTA